MKHLRFHAVTLIFLPVFLSGCATTSVFINRSCVADKIAKTAGFNKEYIEADGFTLMTYQRFKSPLDNLRIYIEGDGRAWETRSKLSDDPTPSNPVALKLAAVDPADNIAYIARPGQFSALGFPGCDSKYWSGRRFATEVVEAFDKIIDILKKKSGTKNVELVGYSGGGAIAVLVAAARSDVVALRTVAGNLDSKEWCVYHNVNQLDDSLNPIDVAAMLTNLPQRHFVGSNDPVIPSSIARSFVKKMGDGNDRRITTVHGVTHHSGWREHWSKLLMEPLY